MLHKIGYLANQELDRLKELAASDGFSGFSGGERKWFSDLSNTVARLAKTEIEVERHQREDDATMSVEEIQKIIRNAVTMDEELQSLVSGNVLQRVVERVLSALGMTK